MPEIYENDEKRIEMILPALISKCVDVFSSFELERKRIFKQSENNKRVSFLKHFKEKKVIRKNIPPEDALIRFSQVKDVLVEPTIKNVWRLQNNKLTVIDDLTIETRLEPESGRYYSQAEFNIAIDLFHNEAHFSYIMGPLFGRGYTINIEYVDGVPYLGEEKLIWMS